MHFVKTVVLMGMFLGVSTTAAYAQADAVHGRELAQQWCTQCHNVAPGGPFKQYPPSFASMAIYRSEEQIHSRIVFPPLHTGMPQIGNILTPENVEDIVAYILSLEDKQ